MQRRKKSWEDLFGVENRYIISTEINMTTE